MGKTVRLVGLTAVALWLAVTMVGRAQSSQGEWPAFAADKASTRYSALDQINKNNIKNLRIVWRQSAIPPEMRKEGTSASPPVNYEHTPLMVGGLVYMGTGLGTIAALDPVTGKVVWSDTSGQGEPAAPSRGVAYWSDGRDQRIFAVVGQYLVAVNAKSGKRYSDFGEGGRVDLAKGYRRVTTGGFRWSSPPVIVRDVIVVGGLPGGASDIVNDEQLAKMEAPPGDVRGFDVRTGKLLWTFHTVPAIREFGYDSWLNESASYSGNTGIWGKSKRRRRTWVHLSAN
jgi:quinoprotein glucose dehydrogenase